MAGMPRPLKVSLGLFNGAVLVGTVGVNMAIAARRFDVTEKVIRDLHRMEFGSVAENYLGAIVMNEAWLSHRIGDIEGRDRLLGNALARARDKSARVRLRWCTNAMSELLPVAIANGIETDTARLGLT